MLIDTIQTTFKKGDTVALIGFGTFKSAKRAARVGKNPRTGEKLKISAATLPKFTPGAKFKAVVDPKAAARKAKAAGKQLFVQQSEVARLSIRACIFVVDIR